jgi:hypothetical protein
MSELDNAKVIKCPWCHNSLNIIRSGKSGLHYANCGSCNAHFRNIPLALVGIPDNSAAVRRTDNVSALPSANNANLKTDKEMDLAKRREGIPEVLWKYLPGSKNEDHNE